MPRAHPFESVQATGLVPQPSCNTSAHSLPLRTTPRLVGTLQHRQLSLPVLACPLISARAGSAHVCMEACSGGELAAVCVPPGCPRAGGGVSARARRLAPWHWGAPGGTAWALHLPSWSHSTLGCCVPLGVLQPKLSPLPLAGLWGYSAGGRLPQGRWPRPAFQCSPSALFGCHRVVVLVTGGV